VAKSAVSKIRKTASLSSCLLGFNACFCGFVPPLDSCLPIMERDTKFSKIRN